MNQIQLISPENRSHRLVVMDNMNRNGFLSDPKAQSLLSNYEIGVDVFQSGAQDLAGILSRKILALLVDGWNATPKELMLVKHIRNSMSELPIMIITYDRSDEKRTAAYEAGADDVIAVPCAKREFSARLGRLTMRTPPQDDVILVRDLKLWTNSRVVMRDGQLSKLSQKEMAILLYLVDHSPNPVSRNDILKSVFGLNFDPGTNAVEVHMHRLREKIDKGQKRQLLNTIRGTGYAFGAPTTVDQKLKGMNGAVKHTAVR